jgi:glycosyltransferase involved in cell wall biosynthesis
MKVVIVGPAHPLRGGLATFNQRLAEQFIKEGDACTLVSFSLQYPEILFPGKTQYSSDPAPAGLKIHSWINSVNPLNWWSVGKKIAALHPDIVVVRFWIPFMGPSLGTVLRAVRKNRDTRIICIADNVIPHERRIGDRSFTRYFLKACDGFITMSERVLADLRRFEKVKPAQLVQHPLYDTFGEPLPKTEARQLIGLDADAKIILFFGFIRRYKGLDILLKAMAEPAMKDQNIRLLIAGEFYEDEDSYKKLIDSIGIRKQVILHNHFIADSEVRNYLCAADCVVQPYRDATQSGVTPLAYHFNKPMVVTNVGGLPSLVPHEKAGLVAEPEPKSIANAILRFYQLGENYFIPHLRVEKQKYAWNNLTDAIRKLADIGGER